MPSLRDLRNRISSVKSTRKITSAMKMVAAAKLRKAQEAAEASQPYARAMGGMIARLSEAVSGGQGPRLLSGNGRDKTVLMVVVTSDRGLAGGFNGNLIREVRAQIKAHEDHGRTIQILPIGRKGRDLLKAQHADKFTDFITGLGGKGGLEYDEVRPIIDDILVQFEDEKFDRCELYYNVFQSVLVQRPTRQQLIPFEAVEASANDNETADEVAQAQIPYNYEPSEEEILEALLPRNVGTQLYRALLDSAAGEQAARMTAMDNATRNAGDMIKRITLEYNRARQAYITKELIEIISGAEAV